MKSKIGESYEQKRKAKKAKKPYTKFIKAYLSANKVTTT